MGLSRRRRKLAWEGLGWSVAAGLAIALTATVWAGLARVRSLEASLAAAQSRTAVSARGLAVCEATTASLKNLLAAVQASPSRDEPGAPLTPEGMLARRATGADACARAFEAEALVREAAR